MWGSIILTLLIGFEALGVFCAVVAIINGRTPQGTIAWIAGLLLVAPIAVPLFILFGAHRIAGYVRARRKGELAINLLVREAHALMKPWCELVPGADRAANPDLLDVLVASRGNATQLLIDGQATFDAMFAAIDAARDYLLVQFYIINDDQLGRRFLARLLAARARGVRVYFLYDGIGSAKITRAYKRELRRAGVLVEQFRPTRVPRFRVQLNFRNHRKVLVADGRVAFLGGFNIGDEYLGLNPRFGPWRDTHLEVRGPAVQAVQMAFVEDWYCVTSKLPELQWKPEPGPGENARVAIVASGPADDLEYCVLMFLHVIHSAHKRLWIATPYFVPDEGVLASLQAAAMRGVDVRVMVPSRPDQFLVHLAARSSLYDAMVGGVKVFMYPDGFMHQKVALADDIVAIGSANLDNRSLRINFELTALCDHTALAGEVAAMLKRDLAKCRPLDRGYFEEASFGRRLLARLARLFSPVL